MNKKLIENRMNMKNIITQMQLVVIIKNLQEENEILKQNNEELKLELEEMLDNIDSKKLVLFKSREW